MRKQNAPARRCPRSQPRTSRPSRSSFRRARRRRPSARTPSARRPRRCRARRHTFRNVEEVDRVRRLVPVEDALLDDGHLEAITARVDATRAHAAAGRFAAHDDRIDIERVEMRRQDGSEECALRCLFGEFIERIRAHLFTEGSNHRRYPEMNESLPKGARR